MKNVCDFLGGKIIPIVDSERQDNCFKTLIYSARLV